jgi:hypothetical protein
VTPPPVAIRGSREIPPAHVARIRTWRQYGMTITQVAEIYSVDSSEIARVLGMA